MNMNKLKRLSVCVLAAAAAITSGCASMPQSEWMTKENVGTALGVVAGIALGSQVGRGDGRTAAMLIGAFAGGALGKSIGAKLDERDREALALQTQNVLNASQDGEVSTWTSAHSGVSATIVPSSTQTESRTIQMKRVAAVQVTPELQVLNRTFVVTKSANMRSAPDAQAEKVGGLPAGSSFTALGKTSNNWVLVGRKGVAVGYVYGPLVEGQSQVASKAAATDRKTPAKGAGGAIDLDSLDMASAKDQGFDLDSGDVIEEKVVAKTACRTVDYTVTSKGGSDTQKVKACQAADGAWELT